MGHLFVYTNVDQDGPAVNKKVLILMEQFSDQFSNPK